VNFGRVSEGVARSLLQLNNLEDVGWKTFGIAAEVSALVAEEAFGILKAPVCRVTLPDVPAPASRPLESAYYPTTGDIVGVVKRICQYN
jgi:pyruvate/2-oxoglutarate/acetoin dehydrogenase E1 component